ncbi:MAG: SCO family protein [Candidatus Binataceae bacterium]|nr:SCO family protein [Candidatus Binataceae bacterium]
MPRAALTQPIAFQGAAPRSVARRRHWRGLIARVCAGALIAIAIGGPPARAGAEAVTPSAPGASEPRDWLPAAKLIDQNGHPVSLASLKGKIVLVSFIHTSCRGVCEMLTAKMRQVADNLGSDAAARVTMVSITTDPAEDRPPQLLAYAKKEGVDANGWLFLTGPPDQVDRVLAVYNVPHEDEQDELTHVFALYLIGSNGQMVRQYHGMSIAPEVVASDIRKTASP